MEETNEPMCLIESHSGGLTHLMFSPDGNMLFSGARKDSDIFCWDLRNPGKLLQVFKRGVNTNQRVYFDLTPDGKYLCSGNSDGSICFWNGSDFDITVESEPIKEKFQAHGDCANGVRYFNQSILSYINS